MPLLEVCSISKRFADVQAIDNLSFSVEAGQICGFIGPNGAGKTTAMKICATLALPDTGDVLINGLSVTLHPRKVRSHLGFMPDYFPMEPKFLVQDFIEFYARAHGLAAVKRSKMIAEVIAFTGLGPLLDKECESLSKGMRQRTALAATLIHEPSLLILDEPAAGLDPRARIELRSLLKALAEQGTAVLISSHILAELSEICDQVVVIEKGVLCGSGMVDDIRRRVQPNQAIAVQALADADKVAAFLLEQPGVEKLYIDDNVVYFSFSAGDQQQINLLRKLAVSDLGLLSFTPQQIDLEDLFMSLTHGDVQ